jgi:putative hydrolase of the HAD superfamily
MAFTLCFDADDTLWHNENVFADAHARFAEILGRYHERARIDRVLFETEMRNLPIYGYGCKGFALSALETAVAVAGEQLSSREVNEILGLAQDMLRHPVELLPGVFEVLHNLAGTYRLTLLTKGDLHHQERKLLDSGLLPHFEHYQVLSDKTPAAYQRMLKLWGLKPSDFIMIGNSLRSDILPALEIGSHAVWIPYPLTWEHERAEPPEAHPRFHKLASIRELPALLEKLA